MNKEKEIGALGKVIRIISDRELIINVGEMDLTIGDKIQIIEVGEPIYDLDGNCLGLYEKLKDTLEVINTTDNYSICAKITTKLATPFISLQTLSKEITTKEPLNIDEADITPVDLDNDITIKVGDLVKKC